MFYEVLYHRTAPWLVGEKKEEREARFRRKTRALAVAERYPGSYAGRVISIRPVAATRRKRKPLPSLKQMSDKDRPVVVLDLTPAQARAVSCKGAKIVGGKLANVTFEDRHGVIALVLRKQFAHPEEVEAYSEDEFDLDGRQFATLIETVRDFLPAAETHTGTGLYAAKETPTHNDDTQSGAVVENLCLRSEEIDVDGSGVPWIHLNTNVTADQSVAPDGAQTADKFTEDATEGGHAAHQSVAHVNGTTYTVSVYLKKGTGRDWAHVFGGGSPGAAVAYFDLENGVKGQTGGTLSPTSAIVDEGDGWYRCSITYQANVTLPTMVGFGIAEADGSYSFAGSTSNYHYAWGAQCEVGSVATAYQKTEATTESQVVALTTGGLGTSDAFKGGYVTNATRSETRAIIRHIDGSVTLEGDLSSWADTDDLDIYDAWSTIQGELDQLEIDQGTGVAFTATQTMRIYAGTYTENISLSDATFATREDYRLVFEANSGDTPIVQNSGASNTWAHSAYDTWFVYKGLHFKNDQSNKYTFYGYRTSRLNFEDCIFEDTYGSANGYNAIFRNAYGDMIGCRFVNGYAHTGGGLYRECTFEDVYQISHWGNETRLEACWLRFVSAGRIYCSSSDVSINLINCTLYGDGSSTAFDATDYTGRIHARNCIFENWGKVFGLKAGAAADSDFNCFHDVTTIGTYDGTDYTSLANWQAADIPRDFLGNTVNPDSNSIDDDPLLADPAAGDFSLAAASPCLHTGAGAGVKTGINDVAFHPRRPNRGAWASGTENVAGDNYFPKTPDSVGWTELDPISTAWAEV